MAALQQCLLLAPFVGERRITLCIRPAVVLHAGVHRLRQVDKVLGFLGARGDDGFDDFDAVQILHLAVAKLKRDRAVETVQAFHLHDVRVDCASMRILIGFGAGQPKHRLVLNRQVQRDNFELEPVPWSGIRTGRPNAG